MISFNSDGSARSNDIHSPVTLKIDIAEAPEGKGAEFAAAVSKEIGEGIDEQKDELLELLLDSVGIKPLSTEEDGEDEDGNGGNGGNGGN